MIRTTAWLCCIYSLLFAHPVTTRPHFYFKSLAPSDYFIFNLNHLQYEAANTPLFAIRGGAKLKQKQDNGLLPSAVGQYDSSSSFLSIGILNKPSCMRIKISPGEEEALLTLTSDNAVSDRLSFLHVLLKQKVSENHSHCVAILESYMSNQAINPPTPVTSLSSKITAKQLLQRSTPSSKTTEKWVETIAMMSDCLVVWIDINANDSDSTSNSTEQSQTNQSIMKGVRRRIQAGFSKPKLLVILGSTSTTSIDGEGPQTFNLFQQGQVKEIDDNTILEQVMKNELLKNIHPDMFESFYIASSMKDLIQAVWDYSVALESLSTKSKEVTYSQKQVDTVGGFVRLIEQVYSALSTQFSPTIVVESFDFVSMKTLLSEVKQQAIAVTTATITRNDKPIVDTSSSSTSLLENNKESPPPLEESFAARDESSYNSLTDRSNLNKEEAQQEALTRAQQQINVLEEKQDDIWLRDNDDKIPLLLEFGSEADSILNEAYKDIFLEETESEKEILINIATDIKQLYEQQLQALREYYGKRYENVLDEREDISEEEKKSSAQYVTEQFQLAANQCIPTLCRDGGLLAAVDYSSVEALQGLLSDMIEATISREDLKATLDVSLDEGVADDGEETNGPEKKRWTWPIFKRDRNEPAKWYEKLAARLLGLGINYLQGWLTWQGIKKAAEERDRRMPKFPLF